MTFSVDQLNKIMRLDTSKHHLIPWAPSHLYLCELNEFDQQTMGLFDDYHSYLQSYANAGTAFTVLGGGEIHAMFGMWQLWPGVAEAWLIPSKHINKKTIALHRGSLRFFEYASNETGIKRLQFTVNSQNVRADRWARRCHFQKEGVLKQYGPDGSDYFMYARYF